MSSAHRAPSAAPLPVKNNPVIDSGAIESSGLALDAIPVPCASHESGDPILAQRSWPEVLAITLVPPLLSAYFAPDDPLLLGAGHFPWLSLVPLLVGVQHGALAGAVSSGLLVAAGLLDGLLGGSIAPAALAAFAGGSLAAGVISGHFHDRVQSRLARLDVEARRHAQRLARIARAHSVLKRSHQQLEERVSARSWSLVSAFEDARRTLAGQRSLAGVGEVVLHVLQNHALVQSATLLTVAHDARGRVAFEARARVGSPPHVDTTHALVQRALETGRLVALDAETADAGGVHDLLAVAPLASASGRLLGLVLIHEMPFMAFQAENLSGLAAVTALLADLLEDRFIESHAEDALLLSLSPERGLRSGETPDSEIRPVDERHGDERPTEEWLEDELAASDVEPRADAVSGDPFVGTRTGTHQRRGVAQSA